ncbi:flagellar attachment zone-like protein [Plakobranchus ocellatus]|uniref:Flagellar attachment zone-like protein n=1 Tax=Plakobranchus ocellatus TaxID=259542 RepID=A0AAV3Z2S0_9GAST|nr:flagellar attachment zone-like protein [Plakobranchus ocellatus]
MAPGATTMAAAGTTMAPTGTTMAPAGTTMAPAGTTMAPAGTTMPPATTTTAPVVTIPPNKCIQCGGLVTDCSAVDLLLQGPADCPADQQFCFTRVVHSLTDTHIVKGCMDLQTCEDQWWNATSPKPECQNIDLSVDALLDCTYCCQGDGCNKDTRPVDTSLLQFLQS